MKKTLMILAAFAALFAWAANAATPNTWWVDDTYYGAAVQNGSEDYPFGTILAAVTNTACKSGDTIKVKPGTYDKDYYAFTQTAGSTDYEVRVRIYLAKKVNIIAAGSKEETHIVGRWSSAAEGGDDTYHTGPTAVKCFYVANDGRDSTLTGFTLRDSASINLNGDYVAVNGGAISVQNYSTRFYVTDCVISNCVTRRWGGASCGGTFNRCLIVGCAAGHQQGAAVYKSSTINSVIAGCQVMASGYCALSGSLDVLVNCTISGNKSAQVAAANCFNCLFVGNGSVETNGTDLIASNVYASPGRDYCNEEMEFPLFAPAAGDFHPLPDSAAIGAGDPDKISAVTLPSGTEIRDMDGNLLDLTKEHINAGAYQTPKTPRYGAVLFDSPVGVNGFPRTAAATNLVYADSWPMSLKASLEDANFCLAVSGTKTDGLSTRYSDKTGCISITPPYATGSVQTNSVEIGGDKKYSFGVRYVDANNGSDSNNGRTAATAYKTIQKSVSNLDANYMYRIYVAEGDYNENGASVRGVSNRLSVATARWLKFIATGDRDKTIIRGAAAKNERDPANHPGCGSDAVRCVNYSAATADKGQAIAFVGFTFADGHADCNSSSDDLGGAAFGRTDTPDSLQFIDCVFTNCYAPNGGVSANARFTRCRFIDCGGCADGFINSTLSSCIVENGTFGTGVFGPGVCAVNCSVADSNAVVADQADQKLLNCALGEGGNLPASATTWGSTARSCFADAVNGDFRFVTGSPALNAERRAFPLPGDEGWNDFALYFSDYAVDNIDGSAWVFGGGYPVAGAYVGWTPGIALALDADKYSITGGSAGGTALSPGDTVTIARSPDATRHYGIIANGVTNMLDAGTYSYTMPETVDMAEGVCLEQVVDPNWYVNPVTGDDENTGFMPTAAKRTLAAACANPNLLDGDTIHAAPGTYASNSVFAVEDHTIASRVAVRSNTTLVADEGPENTFIVGEGATGEPDGDDSWNCGAGAVRCVYLNRNATIRGFTLTGGRTRCRGGNHYVPDDSGGGILGASFTDSIVENCIVSNNASYRGGAARYATLRKCRIFGNLGYYNGAVGGESVFFGCVADENIGVNQVYGYRGIADCTFGPDNKTNAGAMPTLPGAPGAGGYVSNTVTRCQALATNVYTRTYCTSVTSGTVPEGLFVVGVDELLLDENLRPVIGKNAAIDQAVGPVADVPDPDLDTLGGQRVYNGARDCGALEADWRGRYGRDIGRCFSVQSASTEVTEGTGDVVRVPEGATLAGSLQSKGGRPYDVQLSFAVSSGGTARFAIGAAETVFGEGPHEIRIQVGATPTTVDIVATSGNVDVLSAKSLLGFVLTFQ